MVLTGTINRTSGSRVVTRFYPRDFSTGSSKPVIMQLKISEISQVKTQNSHQIDGESQIMTHNVCNIWHITGMIFKVIDLKWTQKSDFCPNVYLDLGTVRVTPRQLNHLINNDSPLNWQKLFQLRNLLHNANASFFILSLQLFSFSISVFSFFWIFDFADTLFIYPIWVWFISTWKWFTEKIPKAWGNFGILSTVKLPLFQ